ncbi:hypothetical protein OG292_11380 [Streptomyces sp. NBC_01511]|uniref:hypothetical protein n=1 Tax=Streptomyces sp. NBC_01511 TaxID=2903889 RepID=UPI00386FAE3B
MEDEQDWQEVIGAIGLFAVLLIVVALTLWHFTAGRRAREIRAGENEYRQLAAQAVEGQRRMEEQLADLGRRLTDVQTRTGSLERILKDVE